MPEQMPEKIKIYTISQKAKAHRLRGVAKPQLVVSILDLLKKWIKIKYQVGECQKDLLN